jgi:hypothetical protein
LPDPAGAAESVTDDRAMTAAADERAKTPEKFMFNLTI